MTAQRQVDLLLSASWIITVNAGFDIVENHCIAIDKGVIVDILKKQDAQTRYLAHHSLHLEQQALLPGFINCHQHAAMSLLRGYADDLPLQRWLDEFIWPVEQQHVSEDFVRDGTLLACAEMMKSGTTCFNDMYFFPDIAASIVNNCHMRASLSFPVIEFPSAWAKNNDEYIQKGLALHDQYKQHPLISTAFGPHAPYTVSIDTFRKIDTLAEELDLNIHMHLHETRQEIENYRQQHQCSAIEHYAKLGLLSPRLQAVHLTQVTASEIELLAKHHVSVVHCPESNMKLASGISPISQMQALGINVALGTDGSASNNDSDMIGEMKSAALLAKIGEMNASALPVQQVLRMATIDGARLLGIDSHCGSLETGKAADIISIDLSQLESQPVYHPASQIVYNAGKHQVSNVWIQGKQVLSEGKLKYIDEKEVIHKATYWRNKIRSL